MSFEQALLRLDLHFPLNTWLQYVAQRQLQYETRNIYVLGFGVPNIIVLKLLRYKHMNFSNSIQVLVRCNNIK